MGRRSLHVHCLHWRRHSHLRVVVVIARQVGGAALLMYVSLVSLQMLLPLEFLSTGVAPEWPRCLLSKMNNFVVTGQSLLSCEELVATLNLTTMHRLIRVLLCVSLQMLLSCESFLTSVAIIHSFQLLTPVGALYVLGGPVVDHLLSIGIFGVQLCWRSLCASVGLERDVSLNIDSFTDM